MTEVYGPKAKIVAGLGARAGAGSAEILQLIDECLAVAKLNRAAIVACATAHARREHSGLLAAAAALNVPLLALGEGQLAVPVPNPSPRVVELTGLASIAEASALYFGPLVVEKRRSGQATCALARASGYEFSTESAASTLATSGAGA